MCCSIGGYLIAIIVMAKIYNDGKVARMKILFFGCLYFKQWIIIALDAYKKKQTNETSVPSMVSLPFELNLCFAKIFWYLIKIISFLCSMCTLVGAFPGRKEKNKINLLNNNNKIE